VYFLFAGTGPDRKLYPPLPRSYPYLFRPAARFFAADLVFVNMRFRGVLVNRGSLLLPQHVGFWLTKFLPSASTLC
jgi:hypothetical protein